MYWRTQGGRGGCRNAAPLLQIEIKKKKTDFVDTIISELLCNLHFSLDQPLKSADDWYIGILNNITNA